MRRHDWQLRLSSFVQTRARTPFVWGSNDCCLFAADAVEAMTGVDLAASLRGYDSELTAQQIIDAHGGLEQLVTGLLGAAVSPLLAGVGDVVLLESESGDMLAICNGVTAVAPAKRGMAVLAMNAARAAWRI